MDMAATVHLVVGTAGPHKLAKSLQLPKPVFSARRLAGVYGYGRLHADNASSLRWELVQCDSHALAAQQGAVLDSVVLVQQSREPFAARSSDSAQRPQIGGPGAVRVHARWSWSSLALSRWLGGWGFAIGGMLAGVVFGAVGLAGGMCVAVRLLRASGRVPVFRIKSLARTRQSTRRRGRCHRQSLLSRGGVHPPDTGFSGC